MSRYSRRRSVRKNHRLKSQTFDGADGYTLLLQQRAEVMSYKAQRLFDWLVSQVSKSRYHKPAYSMRQQRFDHVPKK